MVTRHLRRWKTILLAFVLAEGAFAAIELSAAVDRIAGEDWSADGISFALQSASPGRAGLTIGLSELVLPEGHGRLRGVQLVCQDLETLDGGWRCGSGRLHADESPVGPQQAAWQGSYSATAGWQLEIGELQLARGTAALTIGGSDGEWRLDVRLHRLATVPLAQLTDTVDLPAGWQIRGRTSGMLTLHGDPQGPVAVKADLVVDRISFASPDGRHAAENTLLKLDASARKNAGNWLFSTRLAVPRGAVYADPVFIDTGAGTIHANAQGAWDAVSGALRLDAWGIRLPDVVDLNGTGQLQGDKWDIRDLTLVARSDHGGALYDVLLQPFLIGTAADDLAVEGSVGMVLHYDRLGIEQAGLELSGFALTDRQGRYALGKSEGSVAWDRAKEVPVSRLSVTGAGIYQIPTGPFSIEARFSGDGVSLQRPVVVPVSGGEVRLDSFELSGALVAGNRPRWKADASVHGVSLEQLTDTLNWPRFNGSIDGELRDMRYSDQLFQVGGGLDVSAFDGTIMVRGLQIRDPLGLVPSLTADAEFRGVSLLALTEAFSFGRIEGRLDGEIRDLRLLAWQPDSFEMHLYTPEDDDLKHRISQRAVENLTEIGNGISAGLSTTFLRVFEEFRYDRIDLKVSLQGAVAELDGLARPDGGYYLVKGAGLPRIDVIGRNRSVAWKDLVERLRRIQVEGARIE